MRTAKTAHNVKEQIELALAAGEWRAGERLPEARLAKHFGVSRTPVREAVRRLSAAGVLEQAPNQAPRVRAPLAEELEQLYDLRIELGGYAIERAAAHATDAEKQELRDAAEGFAELADELPPDAVLDTKIIRRLVRIEQRFHGTLNRAAHNPWLEEMLEHTDLLAAVFLRVIRLGNGIPAHDALRRSHERHATLAGLIAAGRGEEARAYNTANLTETRNRVANQIAAQDKEVRHVKPDSPGTRNHNKPQEERDE